jgi:ankyrin repeat protein
MRDRIGFTALYIAADRGNFAIVRELLAAGSNPNASPRIIRAAVQSGNILVVRALLSAGLDPNMPGLYGKTALHSAVIDGNLPVIRELLAAGADPNIRDRGGATALLNAAMHGNVPVIRELIEWGADPTLADNRDRTPLDYPAVQQAWQERLAAQRGLDEFSTRHNLPPGFSEQVFRILYPS